MCKSPLITVTTILSDQKIADSSIPFGLLDISFLSVTQPQRIYSDPPATFCKVLDLYQLVSTLLTFFYLSCPLVRQLITVLSAKK